MTITEIKKLNKEAGYFFFSKETMCFFDSRVESRIFESPEGVFFITSEKRCFDDYTRVWAVRRFKEDCSVETVQRDLPGKLSAYALANDLASRVTPC